MNMIAPRHLGLDVIRAGNFSVRLALTAAEIDAAQALRYAIFYEEMGASADAATRSVRRAA